MYITYIYVIKIYDSSLLHQPNRTNLGTDYVESIC